MELYYFYYDKGSKVKVKLNVTAFQALAVFGGIRFSGGQNVEKSTGSR